jgi:uncharacterized protein
MVIGLLLLELQIPDVHTLKQRRMVVNSLRDNIHNKFNVSFSEVSEEQLRNRCTMAATHVSNRKTYSNRILSKIVDYIESSRKAEIEDYSITFL